MAAISLRRFAGLVGSNTVSGMARGAGMTWPPPPAIFLRSLIATVGAPLQPDSLSLSWDLDVAGKPILHTPEAQAVPVNKDINFTWHDAGQAGVRRALSWQVPIKVAATGQDFVHSPFSVQNVPSFGIRFDTVSRYSWSVVPLNDFGQGSPSPVFTLQTTQVTGPPPPPPPPPPAKGTLTLRLTMGIPALKFSITKAQWQLTGPGAPATPQDSTITPDGHVAQFALPLPPPSGQSSVLYTIRGTVAFHYEALTGPSGVTGAEDSEVSLNQPAPISWTGQSLVALFSLKYDGFNNVFVFAFDGPI
jgi:hypothetical protein